MRKYASGGFLNSLFAVPFAPAAPRDDVPVFRPVTHQAHCSHGALGVRRITSWLQLLGHVAGTVLEFDDNVIRGHLNASDKRG